MNIVEKQFQFVLDLMELFYVSIQNGFVITLGEAYRTKEQQEIYMKTGKSKTMKSRHLERMAIDLNFFKNGSLCGNSEIKPLGKFWEGLRQENRWGGSWRGKIENGESTFMDTSHFETI